MKMKSLLDGGARMLGRLRGAGIAAMVGLAVFVAGMVLTFAGNRAALAAAPGVPNGASADEPWTTSQLVEPDQLAKELTGDQTAKPFVICVGFQVLYDQGHVPGSVLLGPAREVVGLNRLEDAARCWPRNRDIVIYCGCCPFSECPNVRPAFSALKRMGFTRLRVLDIPHNFGEDWVRKDFPVEKPAPGGP